MDFSKRLPKTWLVLAALILIPLLAWSIYPLGRKYISRIQGISATWAEREQIESVDPALWNAVARLRTLIGSHKEQEVLFLWNVPEDTRELFTFYRISYELIPIRIWFCPQSDIPVSRTNIVVNAATTRALWGHPTFSKNGHFIHRSPLNQLDTGKLKFAAIGSYGNAEQTAIYSISHLPDGNLNLKQIDPLPEPSARVGAKHAWLWPFGLISVFLMGYIFLKFSGLGAIIGNDYLGLSAFSFLCGCGVITITMLILSVIKIRWQLPTIIPAIFIFLTAFRVMFRQKYSITTEHFHRNEGEPIVWFDILGLTVIGTILALAIALVFAPLPAMANWDVWAMWHLKARACWEEMAIPSEYLSDRRYSFSCQDYPLGLALIHTYLAFWAGGINEVALRLLSPLFLFCVVAIFALILREFGIHRGRWLLTAFLSIIPALLRQATKGYADLPVSAAMTACFFLMLMAIRGNIPIWVVAWMGGIASTIKDEGIPWAIGCLTLAFIGLKNGKRTILAYALAGLLFICMAAPWKLFTFSIGLYSINRGPQFLKSIAHSGNRLKMVAKETFMATIGPGMQIDDPVKKADYGRFFSFRHHIGHWLLLWHIIFACLIIGIRRLITRPHIFIILLLLFQLSAYTSAYLVGIHEIRMFLSVSLNRLLLQIAPTAFILGIICIIPSKIEFGCTSEHSESNPKSTS